MYVIAEKDVHRKVGNSEEPALLKNRSKGSLLGSANTYPALSVQTRNSIKQDKTHKAAPQGQMQANMSGLLNMSKQRAYIDTKEGGASIASGEVQPPSPSTRVSATHATHNSHFTGNDARFDESL